MRPRYRVLPLETHDAYTNMAVDEALLRAGTWDITLRFFRWKPSAVSLGYFQKAHRVVNLDVCRELGVDVVRRLSGGGAVYHDAEGELAYSIAVSARYAKKLPASVPSCYKMFCGALVKGLRELGLAAEHKRPSNILVRGRKISGSALARRFGGLLQHGTILRELNLEVMFSLLRLPPALSRAQLLAQAAAKVTSLKRELDKTVPCSRLARALTRGFEDVLGVAFERERLTAEERALAEKLRRERYATKKWNFLGMRSLRERKNLL
jgi:lipoate-protein ligase A